MRTLQIFVSLVSIFLLTSVSSFANYTGPILSKTTSPGFAPEDYAIGFKCDLFLNKIVITKSVGHLSLTEEKKISMTENDIIKYIEVAYNTKPQFVAGPSDAPTTTYMAYIMVSPNPNLKVEPFVLEARGSFILTRDSLQVRVLVKLLNKVCGD